MMGTDGLYWPEGFIHPRCFGTAPRLLGPCVRDWKVCTLEQAVYKLSGHPAARFGLKQRGFIKPGYFADLVIFDEEQISDSATYEKPQQHAVGIDYVLVNGVMIIKEANKVKNVQGPLPGRYLKYNQ
jgi:N-acyl-D-amino-acid deacylase